MTTKLKMVIPALLLMTGANAFATVFTSETAWRAALTDFTNDTFQTYTANSNLTYDALLNVDLSLSGGVGAPQVQDAAAIGGLSRTGTLVLSDRGLNFSTLTILPHSGQPLFALGYWNVGLDDTTILRAYDVNNTLIESITTPSVTQNLSFQGYITSTAITRVTIDAVAGNGYYTIDDLQVGTTTPEPASALMLLSALGALQAFKKRNRNAV